MKKTREFLHPFTILVILLFFVMIMTHILPAGRYAYGVFNDKHELVLKIEPQDVQDYDGGEKIEPLSGTYVPLEGNPQNFMDVITSPAQGMLDALDVIFFILILGGFIGIILHTGAMNRGIQTLLNTMKGKEIWIIPILVFLCSLGGTVFGMEEEALAFYPLMIPIFLSTGFDSVIAPLIIIGGALMGGVWNSVTNPFAVGTAAKFAGIPLSDGMGFRIIMLLIFNVIISWFIIRYALKVKKHPEKSLVYMKKDVLAQKYLSGQTENVGVMSKTDKWIMFIFSFSFLFMIYAILPDTILGEYALNWWLQELTGIFLVASILIGFIARLGEKDFIRVFVAGSTEFLGVGFVIALARGVSLMLNRGMIADTILFHIENVLGGLSSSEFLIIAYLVLLPLVFFVPSTSGLATLVMPIMAPVASVTGTPLFLLIVVYMMAVGTVNPINPTNGTIVAGISFAELDYLSWVKLILPLIGILVVVSMSATLLYNMWLS